MARRPNDAKEMLAPVLSIEEYRQLYNRKHKLTAAAGRRDPHAH